MRCIICNQLLTDGEVVRRQAPSHPEAGDFVDTCKECLDVIRDMSQDYEIIKITGDKT